jgi:hypothetical protein
MFCTENDRIPNVRQASSRCEMYHMFPDMRLLAVKAEMLSCLHTKLFPELSSFRLLLHGNAEVADEWYANVFCLTANLKNSEPCAGQAGW